MAKIIWDEDDELVRIENNDVDDCPEDYVSNRQAAALLKGQNGFKFEEPIWMPAKVAYELDEAGIINLLPDEAVRVGKLTVYVYETA